MTPTITNSPTDTPLVTDTPTVTSTPSPYPAGSQTFDDFDGQGFASTGNYTGNYMVGQWTQGGNTMACSIVNTIYMPASSPGSTGTHSLQVTAHVASTATTNPLENLFMGQAWGAPVNVGTPPQGATMMMNFDVYVDPATTGPMTVANVFLWDNSGDHFSYTGLNTVCPVGVWTNVVVPVFYGPSLANPAVSVNLPFGGGGGWANPIGTTDFDWTADNLYGMDIFGPLGTDIYYYDNLMFTTN
jgi:hypothetical protein